MSQTTPSFPLTNPSDPKYIYDVKEFFPPPSLFEEEITHPAIIIPSKRTAELRRSLSSVLMHRPKVKNVYAVLPEEKINGVEVSNERKLVLKRHSESNLSNVYDFPALKELLENENNLKSNDSGSSIIRKSTHIYCTNYSQYNVEETLKKILPSNLPEVPSAFEIVGHIAHLNLRDDCLPFKFLIGKVILDKNAPTIKLVVNKIGNVEGEFRTFPMEIIASSGNDLKTKDLTINDNTLEVEVKEEGCKFQLNFQHVYWNSRLQFEHKRLVQNIAGKVKNGKVSSKTSGSNDPIIVADVMAGVGPFAVPLASKYTHIKVHANDLNPRSHHYLLKNSSTNKCGNRLVPYNMDGRGFIHHLIDLGIHFDHAIMNLPATAIEFLDAFRGYDFTKAPCIHVHCFASKDSAEAEKEVLNRVTSALGCALDRKKDYFKIHVVRDISPKKNMLCVSFHLPESIKKLEKINIHTKVAENKDANEPPIKKTKLQS